MNKRVLLITGIVFLVVFSALARQRTVEQAMAVAMDFLDSPSLRSFTPGGQETLNLVYTATDVKSETQEVLPFYYVFDRSQGRGFVIVSSDDRAKEVLGYSDAGSFDAGRLPGNLKYWLSMYERELGKLAVTPGADMKIQPPATRAPAFEASVAPLLKSKWDQYDPYNIMTPAYSDNALSATGCVATAMAQIMNYHQWPAVGRGSHRYTTRTLGINLTADFGAATYDWDNMPNTFNGNTTEAQKEAVATLMFHCGVAVDMDYGEESAAYSRDVHHALKTYFGYDTGIEYILRDYTPQADWVAILKTELSAGRPVYYAGDSDEYGHAFVCDGYDDGGRFHFNWGWSGSFDGYFELSALNPLAVVTDEAAGGFNYWQEIITGIQPMQPVAGEDAGFKLVYDAMVFSTARLPVIGLQIHEFGNIGTSDFNGHAGVALYTEDNTLVEYKRFFTGISLKPYQFYSELPQWEYTLPRGLSAGVYKLYPACSTKADPDRPVVMTTTPYGSVPYLIITVSPDGSFTVEDFRDTPDLTLESFTTGALYKNRLAEVKAKIVNNGNDYLRDLRITLGDQSFSWPVSIAGGETRELAFTIRPSAAAGVCQLSIDYDGTAFDGPENWVTLGAKSVTVRPEPAAAALSVTVKPSFPNAGRVNRMRPDLRATVKNAGGYFDGDMTVFVFATDRDLSVAYFGLQKVFLEQGGEKEVVFNSEIALEPGNYIAAIGCLDNEEWRLLSDAISFALTEPSADNNLSGLTLSQGVLSPAFDPSICDYTASVPFSAGVITIQAAAASRYAVISGAGSRSLVAGDNTLTIVSTAENGSSKTYTITVTRDPFDPVGVSRQPSEDISVTFMQSVLLVDSPSDEIVAVYSVNGRLLFLDKKVRGRSAFIINSHINEKIVIVNGSSGWTRKIAH
jgi:hypothetical protein